MVLRGCLCVWFHFQSLKNNYYVHIILGHFLHSVKKSLLVEFFGIFFLSCSNRLFLCWSIQNDTKHMVCMMRNSESKRILGSGHAGQGCSKGVNESGSILMSNEFRNQKWGDLLF